MEPSNKNLHNCYADRLVYKIEKAAIYLRLRGSNLLQKKGADLTIEQFVTLETIAFNPDICQRDLSRIVLKDRSNTSRILNILEEKGLIIRELANKGKRPVKKMKLTKAGEKIIKENSYILKEDMENFLAEFRTKDLEIIKKGLDRIIEKISETANIQI